MCWETKAPSPKTATAEMVVARIMRMGATRARSTMTSMRKTMRRMRGMRGMATLRSCRVVLAWS